MSIQAYGDILLILLTPLNVSFGYSLMSNLEMPMPGFKVDVTMMITNMI